MELILQLILTPIALWLAPRVIKGVYLKDIQAAVWTALSIMVVGFFVGWLITAVLNLATLGILSLVGLGVLLRIVANAIVIEIIDYFRQDFETVGFLPSLWLAVLLAVVWGLVELIV